MFWRHFGENLSPRLDGFERSLRFVRPSGPLRPPRSSRRESPPRPSRAPPDPLRPRPPPACPPRGPPSRDPLLRPLGPSRPAPPRPDPLGRPLRPPDDDRFERCSDMGFDATAGPPSYRRGDAPKTSDLGGSVGHTSRRKRRKPHRTSRPCGAFVCRNRAASYSPRGSTPKYHRR